TRLLKRQLHLQKSSPKTFSVSWQVKYVAATNAQLRKGAWLQRSFTLSTLTCSPRDEPAVVGRAVALTNLFLFNGYFGRFNYRKNIIALFEVHSLDRTSRHHRCSI